MKRAFFLVFLSGALGVALVTTATGADVVLNEIQADNLTTLVHGGEHPDWIELYNNASTARDLSGMSLSDDPSVPRKFTFPQGTQLPAKGRLLVWCDDVDTTGGYHTGFALSADGQTVTLYAAGAGLQTIDRIAFGLQVADLSIGRVPDGTGTWQLCQPTPESVNRTQVLGVASKLRINEWMALPDAGEDWFELHNADAAPVALGGLTLTDDRAVPDLSPIPDLSFLAGAGIRLFWADKDPERGANHANFKLSDLGEEIRVYAGTQVIDGIMFAGQVKGVSEGRLPDGGNTIVTFTKTASPAESNYLLLTNLVVNELLAHTDPPLEDAVEFHNPTAAAVDLSGWYLSNSRSQPKKYLVPNGTTVPAGGFRVFYEFQFNASPGDPAGFTFNSAHGDDVVLSEAKGGVLTGYRVYEKFSSTANGVSLGRHLTSTGSDFPALAARTFGQDDPATLSQFRQGTGGPNVDPAVGPIVIGEIMYHPPDVLVGTIPTDNTLDEFIELRNIASATTPLYDPLHPDNTWRLRNGVDFRFPEDLWLPSQGHLLVVSFDPSTNGPALAAFRAKYAVPSGVRILGPFKGKLDNGGEAIELAKPDPPQEWPHPDVGYVPYILVDRVNYKDTLPWPIDADGAGSSLQRRNAAAYGNDAANWTAATPTAGGSPTPPTFDSIRATSTQVVIGFTSQPGTSYTLQYLDAAASGAWRKLVDVPSAPSSQVRELTDALGGPGATRFYRLVSPIAP